MLVGGAAYCVGTRTFSWSAYDQFPVLVVCPWCEGSGPAKTFHVLKRRVARLLNDC